jgi:hypothetical protein
VSEPDWIFYQHDGPTEVNVISRLVEEFPDFRPRWEKHIEWWGGKPAGHYNDITVFAHFALEDLYMTGKTDELKRAFDLMEYWLVKGSSGLQQLIQIGFLEDFQNLALGQKYSLDEFLPFLGPKSREGWDELVNYWASKNETH